MISCSAISTGAGAAGYFSDSFAKEGESPKGAENYYLDGKAEMTWQGKGAEYAGLSDKSVTSQAFTDVLDGKLTNPATGEIQDLSTASKGHRSGWDFTISPPKSVSTVALVGGDDRVVDAHLAASHAAMAWIERNGAQYRASTGGEVETHASGNLIWATTTHQTNRLDEPNLHNHNVIANATWDEKAETWRSLTNDEMFRIRQMGDLVYKAELANKLEELGYKLTREKSGNFEIDGASEFNKAFSSRSETQKEAVEANLRAKEIDPATASYEQRNQAKLETRPEKGELTLAQAKEGWKETESKIGANFEALVANARARARDPEMEPTVKERQDTASKAVGMAVAHLSEREASFRSADLEVAAIKFGGGSIKEIRIEVEKLAKGGNLVKRDQKGVPAFTTKEGVLAEKTIEKNVKDGSKNGHAIIKTESDFDKAVAKFNERKSKEEGVKWTLSSEQVASARNALMHSSQFQAIQGLAGTGKTAAAEFVKEAIEARGGNIRGMAPTGKATNELAKSAGIKSQTISAVLIDHEKIPKQLRKEIAALKASLEVKKSGKFKANIRTLGMGKAKDEYSINQKNGKVFRANMGITNLKNTFAAAVRDKASGFAHQAKRDWKSAQTAGEHLGSGGRFLGGKLVGKLASEAVSWRKVGPLEAVAVKVLSAWSHRAEVNQVKTELAVKEKQLSNLEKTGSIDGKKTYWLLDEVSLVDAKTFAKVTQICRDQNITLIGQGDRTQISSVGAGNIGDQYQNVVKENGGAYSELNDVQRFKNANENVKEAQQKWREGEAGGDNAKGKFAAAVALLTQPEVASDKLHKTVADAYIELSKTLQARGLDPEKRTIGVVAATNEDRKGINDAIHKSRQDAGTVEKKEFTKEHFGDPQLTKAEKEHAKTLSDAKVDTFEVVTNGSKLGFKKGEIVKVTGFDFAENKVTIQGDKAQSITLSLTSDEAKNFKPTIIETRSFSVGDEVAARANIGERYVQVTNEKGCTTTQKDDMGMKVENPDRITNGEKGVITKIDKDGAEITFGSGKSARHTTLTNAELRNIDLGYVQTAHKEQGQTNAWELVAVSEKGAFAFAQQIGNVSITRAKEGCMVITSAKDKMLAAVERRAEKSAATDIGKAPPKVVVANPERTLQEKSVAASQDLLARSDIAKKVEKMTQPEVKGDAKDLHSSVAKRYIEVSQDLTDKTLNRGAQGESPDQKRRTSNSGVHARPQKSPGSKSEWEAGFRKELSEIAVQNRAAADATLTKIFGAEPDRQTARAGGNAQSEKPPAKDVAVVAFTDADRKGINTAVHAARQEVGEVDKKQFSKVHFGIPQLSNGAKTDVRSLREAGVDSFVSTKSDRQLNVKAGDTLKVVSFDGYKNEVTVKTPDGKEKKFNPADKANDALRPTKAETREMSNGDRVVANSDIFKKVENGRNEMVVKKGTSGDIKQIDNDGAAVAFRQKGEISTTYLSNSQIKHLDLGYAVNSTKDLAGQERVIAVCSQTGISNFQKEAGNLVGAGGRKETEVVTNSKAEMMNAIGGSKPEKTERKVKERELAKEPTREKEASETLNKKRGIQREMSL